MDTKEFKKYTSDRGNAKNGLAKVVIQFVVEIAFPVIGKFFTKFVHGIQKQINDIKMKDALKYLDETKISKEDVSIENIVKIIRYSKSTDWDYEELKTGGNYPKYIANLNYRLILDISIKVIKKNESKERRNWMPVTFIEDDFKWYNTSFIFFI